MRERAAHASHAEPEPELKVEDHVQDPTDLAELAIMHLLAAIASFVESLTPGGHSHGSGSSSLAAQPADLTGSLSVSISVVVPLRVPTVS